MKPKEKKPEAVFRIIHSGSGQVCGSYSRACCDEFDFNSVEEARSSNCHGMYEDKAKYNIAKYKVTYELIDSNVDPATCEETKEAKEFEEIETRAWKEAEELDLNLLDTAMLITAKKLEKEMKDTFEKLKKEMANNAMQNIPKQ